VRNSIVLLTAAWVLLVLFSTAALAKTINGTNRADDLRGTNGADLINAKSGNDWVNGRGGDDRLIGGRGKDSLEGSAGNDTYIYQNGWGFDGVVVDWDGQDTMDFRAVTADMDIVLASFPRETAYGASYRADMLAYTSTARISGDSEIENAIGGSGSDHLYGGEGANTLQPGGGTAEDVLWDYGGWVGRFGDDDQRLHDLTPTDATTGDTYKGFSTTSGFDYVVDYGGAADKLDLSNFDFGAGEAVLTRVDSDPYDGLTNESLIVTFGPHSGVMIYDYFGAVQGGITPTAKADCGSGTNGTRIDGCTISQSGTIEQLAFADQTLSLAQVVQQTTETTIPQALDTGVRSTSGATSKSGATATERFLSNAPDFDGTPRFLETPRR
jgi:Peptidase M10 serralysin C terminal/RTX calcium-binding nonapeptide repeat (4 copies)